MQKVAMQIEKELIDTSKIEAISLQSTAGAARPFDTEMLAQSTQGATRSSNTEILAQYVQCTTGSYTDYPLGESCIQCICINISCSM